MSGLQALGLSFLLGENLEGGGDADQGEVLREALARLHPALGSDQDEVGRRLLVRKLAKTIIRSGEDDLHGNFLSLVGSWRGDYQKIKER
jgi:hypothetical protein